MLSHFLSQEDKQKPGCLCPLPPPGQGLSKDVGCQSYQSLALHVDRPELQAALGSVLKVFNTSYWGLRGKQGGGREGEILA